VTAQRIGALARQALLEEVWLTPKPGLVDRAHSGAHTDMDVHTFEASADALEPYFTRFAKLGQCGAALAPTALFATLRQPGLEAESAMLAATGGVNTHKGAIFSLGLLSAAAGRRLALGQQLDADALCAFCGEMTRGLCSRELGGSDTHGRRMYASYGATGVRGEAESGFASVTGLALPYFRQLLRQGTDLNEAGVRTLLVLMSRLTDTNVLARSGPQEAEEVRRQALALHRDFSWEGVAELDRWLITRNISPGGCADLVAVCIFLDSLCENK